MMRLYLVMLAVGVTATTSSRCDVNALPKASQTDWSKDNSTLYESLTSFDTISTEHICVTVQPTLTTDLLNFRITYYYENGAEVVFSSHFSKTYDGHFKHVNIEDSMELAHLYHDIGKDDAKSKSESDVIANQELTLIGDPDHYLAYVQCDGSEWVVWIFRKEKTLTAADLVYVHNDLLKHGISVPLRQSRCDEMNGI